MPPLATTPINVVTATYLDPKKYSKFLNIWIYLGVLYGVQYLQYLHVNKKSREWDVKLKKWIELVQKWKKGELQQYDWNSYKYDILPQSIQATLSVFSKAYMENREEEVKIPPSLLMGASFVNSMENVVFGNEKKDTIEKGDDLFSVQILDQNTSNSTIEAMAEEATHSIMEKFEKLNEWTDFDYQQYFATKSPPWKSRFIFNPNEEIPSIEHIKQDEQLMVETPGEQPHEFDRYLFEDFLDQMDPFINHQLSKPSLSVIRGKQGTLFNPSRVHYIMNDIENDRRRIIRNAIESIKLNKV